MEWKLIEEESSKKVNMAERMGDCGRKTHGHIRALLKPEAPACGTDALPCTDGFSYGNCKESVFR